MKILQLSTKVPYPTRDGGAAGIFVFSRAFKALRHTTEIIAVNPPKHFITEVELSENPENIKIHPVSFNTSPKIINALCNLFFLAIPYPVQRFINKIFEKTVINTLQSYNPDIVQIEGIYLCPYISIIRKHSKAKIILRAHNVEHKLWNDFSLCETNPLKKLYLKIQAKKIKQYEKKQLTLVDGVTTVTEIDLTELKLLHPAIKSAVIPFGLPKKSIIPFNNTNEKTIFFIGALDWIPNQEAIIWFLKNVWPAVFKKFPESNFHIAGRNAPENLSRFIKKNKGVTYHGEIADSTQFFHNHTIMVVPLFSGSGIRVKIIEAMQLGKVVIASGKAVEGIPAIPGKHFLLADNEIEFIHVISSIFSSTKNFDQLALEAQLLIKKKFDILAVASNAIDFFNSIKNGNH